MTRRLVLLLLVVAVLCPCMTATAAESGTMTELLEYGTVNDSGSNMFDFTTTVTVSLDVPVYAPLCYVDLVFKASDNTAPTSVSVRYNGAYTALTVVEVTSGVYRAYGTISGYYDDLFLRFNASGTQYYTLLSCRVATVKPATVDADVSLTLTAHDGTRKYAGVYQFDVPEESTDEIPASYAYQMAMTIQDAVAYDKLYVYGSVTYGSIHSIRASYGTLNLPVTVNYIDCESTGEYIQETGSTDFAVNYYGKYIYAMEIDLSGIDRSLNQYVKVYIGGNYPSYTGLTFNVQTVSGSVSVADTTNATWWTRFKTFMTDLFGGDTTESDAFQDEAAQQSGELDDLNDQLQDVTKPPVDDIHTDVDDYVTDSAMVYVTNTLSNLTGDSLIQSMLMMALTVALVAYILFGKR